jgi:P pilus assembly chaperone PapD
MRFLTILFTLCLVSALSHTAKGQGISVSPSRLMFTGNPGETVTQEITFSNSSDKPLSFITRQQDWDRDSLGVKVYYKPNSRPGSNANWISLSSNSVSIEPGQSKKINVAMTIPQKADQLTNSMLFFTQVKEQKPAQGDKLAIGIIITLEIGIQVYYTPLGLNAGDIEFLAFDDRGIIVNDKIKTRQLALKVSNKGSINKDATVRFELTNKSTGEEIKVEPKIIAMLPHSKQWVIVDLPADLKGDFLVVALLDAGSAYDLKIAEKEITYRP